MPLDASPQSSPRDRSKADQILPNIVQLGSTLPRRRKKPTIETWTPPINTSSDGVHTTQHRGAKYKNLYEYNNKHNDAFNLQRNLWKIPSLGNNFLPFKKKNDHDSSNEATELYRPQFSRWYKRLEHENTVVLPPAQTSTRVRDLTHDPTKLNEKKYILNQLKTTGRVEKFVRDEMHIPNVYSQCFMCQECEKLYMKDIYVQTWNRRNDVMPTCTASMRHADIALRTLRKKRQHCDVLGERYCHSCKERRNKSFSLKIEDQLINSKDVNNVHYSSTY